MNAKDSNIKALDYIKKTFPGFQIRKPAYNQLKYSLRFQLGPDEPSPYDSDTEIYNEEYFTETVKRASAIFQTVFDDEDNVIVIYQEFAWKKHRIRRHSYLFKQFNRLIWNTVKFKKVSHVYEAEKRDKWNRAVIQIKASQINYKDILTGISNQDFGNREPRVDGELYFINTDKGIIYHMYDDRGMDVISSDKSAIQPIYDKHKDWILDYNRKEIDEVFKK